MTAQFIFQGIVVAILLGLVVMTCFILHGASKRAESGGKAVVETLRKLAENVNSGLAELKQGPEGLPAVLERLESLERRHETLSTDFTSRAAQLSSRITRLGNLGEAAPDVADDLPEGFDLAPQEEQLDLPMDTPRRKRARRRRR